MICINWTNYGRLERDVVSPEVLPPAGEVVVAVLPFRVSVVEPELVVERLFVVVLLLVVEPFVFVPVLVISVRLPPVDGLRLVELVIPPPELVVEALRFVALTFTFILVVSDAQLPPTKASVKIADNVNVFFII